MKVLEPSPLQVYEPLKDLPAACDQKDWVSVEAQQIKKPFKDLRRAMRLAGGK